MSVMGQLVEAHVRSPTADWAAVVYVLKLALLRQCAFVASGGPIVVKIARSFQTSQLCPRRIFACWPWSSDYMPPTRELPFPREGPLTKEEAYTARKDGTFHCVSHCDG